MTVTIWSQRGSGWAIRGPCTGNRQAPRRIRSGSRLHFAVGTGRACRLEATAPVRIPHVPPMERSGPGRKREASSTWHIIPLCFHEPPPGAKKSSQESWSHSKLSNARPGFCEVEVHRRFRTGERSKSGCQYLLQSFSRPRGDGAGDNMASCAWGV